MSVPIGIAIYLTIWWVVLFAILPIGVRSQHEDGTVTPGTDPSAPVAPRLLAKALVTTAIATVIFVAGFFVLQQSF